MKTTKRAFETSQFTTPPLLVIVGETASGKSTLALKLAQQLNGELICADSWTVRKGVNIGTAKPTLNERQQLPHHLLDVVEPCGEYTAAVFKEQANQVINDISIRGKLPIMVGGTGLYIDGVVFDYGFLPEGDRGARQSLNNLSIHELLNKITSSGIELGDVDVRNKRRLIRLLETNGMTPMRQQLRSNTLIIGLTVERQMLANRITQRVDDMLEAGLETEVRTLSEQYGWGCEALKGVGYRQWQNYFLGSDSLQETRQNIISATKDLAKRQRTWFKRNKSIHWFEYPYDSGQIVDLATTTLDT